MYLFKIIVIVVCFFLLFSDEAICIENDIYIDSLKLELKDCYNDSVKVDLMNLLANEYYSRCAFSQSFVFADQAKDLAHEIQYDRGLAVSYHRLGRISFLENCYDEANHYFNLACQISKKIDDQHLVATCMNSLGLLFKNIQKCQEAKQYYDSAAQICEKLGDLKLLSTIYTNLGRLAHFEGDFESDEHFAQKVLDIGLKLNDDDILIEAYTDIGIRLCYQGANEIGMGLLEKASLKIIEKRGNDDSMLGWVYGTMGFRHMRNNQYDTANHYLKLAMKILKKNFGDASSQVASVHYFYGDLYTFQNCPDSALNHYFRALKTFEGMRPENHGDIRQLYCNIGRAYLSKNLLDKANFYLNKVQLQGGKDKFLATSLMHSAKVHLKKGKYDVALNQLQKSIVINAIDLDDKVSESSPDLDNQYLSGSLLLNTLYLKSQVYRELYLKKSKNLAHLKKAAEQFYMIDKVVQKNRIVYLSDNDKLLYFEKNSEIYKEAFETCFVLFQETNEQKYFNDALYFSERNRASVLLEKNDEGYVYQVLGISDDLIEKEKKIKKNLSNSLSQLNKYYEAGDSIKILFWKNENLKHIQELVEFRKGLEVDYPEYSVLNDGFKIDNLSKVQKLLKDDQVIVNYIIVDSSTYAFLISNQRFSLTKLPDFNVHEALIKFNNSISKQSISDYSNSGYLLYQNLVEPLNLHIKQFKRIIFIPDDELWNLNFDLLLTDKRPVQSYGELEYLIRKYAVSYHYSLNLLKMPDHRKGNNSKNVLNEILAFSLSDQDDNQFAGQQISLRKLRNQRGDIPGTSEEIKAISEIYDGEYFYGGEAREDNFKKYAPNYSLIHLALHGEINIEDPNKSSLIFNESHGTEDGFLHIFEINNLSLQADLVVLSACNSGAGKLYRGEGIVSLGRAFSYAGVNSLVLSRWDVFDETAPSLMKHFYDNLKKGLAKDEALREAKIWYLYHSDNITSSPFYWGNWYVIGDAKEINMSGGNKTWLRYFILISFILFLFLVAKGLQPSVFHKKVNR